MSSDTLDLFRRRRTVRRFTADPVSPDQIESLLEAAMYAPSRLNRQPWHFVVVRDWVVKNEIAAQLRIHPYIEQAPVLVLVCARPSASPTWMMDLAAATENLLLAATLQGLGGAWVGAPDTVLWNALEATLRERLHMPEEVRIAALVALGHPAEQPAPHERAERYDPLKVHWGLWERLGEREREPGS